MDGFIMSWPPWPMSLQNSHPRSTPTRTTNTQPPISQCLNRVDGRLVDNATRASARRRRELFRGCWNSRTIREERHLRYLRINARVYSACVRVYVKGAVARSDSYARSLAICPANQSAAVQVDAVHGHGHSLAQSKTCQYSQYTITTAPPTIIISDQASAILSSLRE